MNYKLYVNLNEDNHLHYVTQLITLTLENFFRRYCIVHSDGTVDPACRFIRRTTNKFYELCLGLFTTYI